MTEQTTRSDDSVMDDVTASPPDGETRDRQWANLLNFGPGKRVPVILQTEASECGLACIAMVANYHGCETDLLTLRAAFPSSLRGARLQDLMDVAAAIGLAARPVKVELSDLDQLYTPCVLHWDMTHFVVMTKVGRGWIEIIDPARGRRRVKTEDANHHFTGVALELDAGPNVQRVEKRPPVSLRALAGSISGIGKGLAQVFALALLLELFGLLAPQFMQVIVDQVLANSDASLLGFLGISFALLLVFRVVVESLRTWTVMWISANVSIGWTGNVFNHLIRLPLDYFGKRFLGDVMSRFGSINIIQQTLTTQFVIVILDGLMAFLTAVMLFVYSPKLATVTILFAVAYGGLRALYYRTLSEASQKQIGVLAVQQSTLIESLRGIQTVRLNNSSAHRGARYMNATADVLNIGIVVQKLNLVFDALGSTTTGAQRIAVLWYGAWLALAGELTAGMLMAFVVYADQFTTRFVGLANYAVQFRLLRLHGERLSDIVLTPPESHVDGTYIGQIKHFGVSFREVSFRYGHNMKYVVDGCSFDVADGEVVAITGVSGSGKSTVAKLLMGVVDYQAGTIKVGGVDLRALGKRKVRSLIASVLQDDQLFSGTVLDNICFFDPSATLEQAQKAAERANMADEIDAMPMGYQTLIGDMGSSLSGGQQQRLLLARAFYREPKILLLDEATSQLDLENENRICAAVRQAGITTIIIAHRPQTIASADRILHMRNGKLHEVPNNRRAPVA
jgi:ATP-binding cassette subfamily B protein RaxB